MKKLYIISAILSGVGSIYSGAPVLHNAQTALWYTNSFGASAEDQFPVLRPELFAATTQSPELKNSLGIGMEDVDFLLGGRVRQEGQMFDRPLTLRDDYNDRYGFVRSKLNLDFTSQYGRRTFGKPAAQMFLRLTAFSIWDDPYLYTPVLSEKVYFHGTNFLKKAEIDSHTHRGVVPLMFLEEGWVKIHFDTFLKGIDYPLSLQVGSFPFIVGRGVSLGDYFEGGVEAFGFERRGDIGNAPQKPTGLLVSIGVGQQGMLELYYSKWRKRSHGPDWTREEVKAKRLDRDETADPRTIERGTNSDNDIFAARLGYNVYTCGESKKLYLEPYGVFLNAPELKVEFDADSGLRQGTVGCMTEYTAGNWSVNFECAVQYGKQYMHPIDRNHVVVEDAYYTQTATTFNEDGEPSASAVAGRLDKQIGQPVKYQSHVVLGFVNPENDAEEFLPYRAYYVSDEMQHINAYRSPAEQGGVIRKAAPTSSTDTHIAGEKYISQKHTPDDSFTNGSLYSQYQFKTGVTYFDTLTGITGSTPNGRLYNANLPFGAQRRFREGYTVTNIGVMALCDVRYSMPSKRMNFSAAVGYIGGDEYPFTTQEVDKTTKSFMPLRDSNYVGRYVTSFVMLYPRKLPRPMEMSDNDLYAHNNYKTMQNLEYIGFGSQWYPLASGTVLLEANVLSFWEVTPPHAWNKYQDRTFPNNSRPGKEDSIYKYLQDSELHFSGSATDQFAASHLGIELNMVLSWRPYKSLQFDLRSGIFIPGGLYTDTQGCPNTNTRRIDEKGEWHYDSLGTQMVSGGQLRVTYKF
jgi:hypothetical protein